MTFETVRLSIEEVLEVYSRLDKNKSFRKLKPVFSSFEYEVDEVGDLSASFEVSSFNVSMSCAWNRGVELLLMTSGLFREVAMAFSLKRNAKYFCRFGRCVDHDRIALTLRDDPIEVSSLISDLELALGFGTGDLVESIELRLGGGERNNETWLESGSALNPVSMLRSAPSDGGVFRLTSKVNTGKVERFLLLLLLRQAEFGAISELFHEVGEVNDVKVEFCSRYENPPSDLSRHAKVINDLFPGMVKKVEVAGVPRLQFDINMWVDRQVNGFWPLFDFKVGGVRGWVGFHSVPEGYWYQFGMDVYDNRYDNVVSFVEALFPGWNLINNEPH